MRELTKKERFNDKVLSRFNLYNSIFSTLPYESIANTGVMLPLFEAICIKGYNNNKNPSEIVEEFFDVYMTDSNYTDQISLLFRFIQYIERQVVLFDAVEDASFSKINNLDGRGTLRSLKEEVESKNKKSEFKKYLSTFKIRPVLTAHPTQFYPGSVLGIITDLTEAVRKNDLAEIKVLFCLGSFFRAFVYCIITSSERICPNMSRACSSKRSKSRYSSDILQVRLRILSTSL